ncbi:MAG: hypothetical protein J6A37_08575, partial [Oscillospiraceae bacterium]|nr:hypothetical protein [Oscillospiraceae bacterium]
GEKCDSISRGGEGINLLIPDRTPLVERLCLLTLQNVPVERFEHNLSFGDFCANLTTAFSFSTICD